MFNTIQIGFEKARQERDNIANKLTEIAVLLSRLQALSEMSLVQKGYSFDQIQKMIEKKARGTKSRH